MLFEQIDVWAGPILMQLFCYASQDANTILVHLCQCRERLCQEFVVLEKRVFPYNLFVHGLEIGLLRNLCAHMTIVYYALRGNAILLIGFRPRQLFFFRDELL